MNISHSVLEQIIKEELTNLHKENELMASSGAIESVKNDFVEALKNAYAIAKYPKLNVKILKKYFQRLNVLYKELMQYLNKEDVPESPFDEGLKETVNMDHETLEQLKKILHDHVQEVKFSPAISTNSVLKGKLEGLTAALKIVDEMLDDSRPLE